MKNLLQQLSHSLTRVLTVLTLCLPITAYSATGQQVFIPIAVGDITTFIPLLSGPSNATISTNTQAVGGDNYNLSWNSVANAAYYQLIIVDENGEQKVIRVTGQSYTLASLPLGNSTVSLMACNSSDQCGAAVDLGTYNTTERVIYAHADILGSPILRTDQAGNVMEEFHYQPFGETQEEKSEDIGYTGHLEDRDLDLTYMQARYYDPVIGRFYGNDRIGYTFANPVMSFNRYLYVNNNPYKYIDPDGEFYVRAQSAMVTIGTNKFFFDTVDSKVDAVLEESSGMIAGRINKVLKYTRQFVKLGKLIPSRVSPSNPISDSERLAEVGETLDEVLGDVAGIPATETGVSREFIEEMMNKFKEENPDGYREFNEAVEDLYGMSFEDVLDKAEDQIEEAADTQLDI